MNLNVFFQENAKEAKLLLTSRTASTCITCATLIGNKLKLGHKKIRCLKKKIRGF
jgi:hypothetical protein